MFLESKDVELETC